MKNVIVLIITIGALVVLNWIFAVKLHTSIIDLSIPLGIGAIIISYILTNKSGNATRFLDKQIQGETGIKIDVSDNNVPSFANISPILIGSVIYTVLSLLTTFYVYKDYFMN